MHTLYICTTCKKRDGDDIVDAHAGEKFYAAVKESFDVWAHKNDFELVPTACLSGCKKSCTFALQKEGKYAYIFGCADEGMIQDIFNLAAAYQSNAQGILKKIDRPDCLKDKVLARIPPLRS